MARRTRYSQEFKLEAVRLMTEQGLRPSLAARDLRIDPEALRRWRHEMASAAPPPPMDSVNERAELLRLRREDEHLRMERRCPLGHLKKSGRHLLADARMSQKYAFIADHASQYPVATLCRVLGMRRSSYYAWCSRPRSAHAQRDQLLRGEIAQAFQASHGTYGSPRVHGELKQRGVHCGQKRVARLMREACLVARPRQWRVRTTDSGHTLPVAKNLVARDFVALAPNTKWVADVTSLPTQEGWLYLAVVLDLFARRVVGWSMHPTLERSLVLAVLEHALQQRRPRTPLIHQSDRGSQYASLEYQARLTDAGLVWGMSRRGNCWDNASMGNFLGTLKTELSETVYPTQAAARSAVFDYIERFYNHQRRDSVLGYLSPAVFEQLYERQLDAA